MDELQTETKIKFPADFLIGAASAAHQVEGNNRNSDWWHWEQQGKLPKSGDAADHYNRYDEDFQLAQDMGLNAVRISIEWARIEPVEGRWDAVAIEHYKKVLKSMKDHGLKRVVTLWHWTMPMWLAEKGGFETKQGAEAFARYAWFVAQNLGQEVDFWITLNEPENYTASSYLHASHPPFKQSRILSHRVLGNLIAAHKCAYQAIKEALGDVPISIAKNNNYYVPYRKYNLLDWLTARFADQVANHYFLEKIKDHLDFIGLNYYFYHSMKFKWPWGYTEMSQNNTRQLAVPDSTRSDMGWLLYPEGIYHMLLDLKRYGKPIYITEIGLADAADTRRLQYIRETLRWVKKAMNEGVDVKGYLYWALTDNYEWQHGFWPRFGLIEIDYATQKRTVRPSAKIFKEIQS